MQKMRIWLGMICGLCYILEYFRISGLNQTFFQFFFGNLTIYPIHFAIISLSAAYDSCQFDGSYNKKKGAVIAFEIALSTGMTAVVMQWIIWP